MIESTVESNEDTLYGWLSTTIELEDGTVMEMSLDHTNPKHLRAWLFAYSDSYREVIAELSCKIEATHEDCLSAASNGDSAKVFRETRRIEKAIEHLEQARATMGK